MVCYIGIGSNVGNRLKNIKKAIACLINAEGVKIKKISPIYKTEPLGGPKGQKDYYNLAVEISSKLTLKNLLTKLKEIEARVGRKPCRRRWSAREIDLDILLCGDLVIRKKDLKVPHPRLHQRFFVLRPLSDLAAGARHPLLGLDVKTMLASLKNRSRWKKVREDTT